MRVSRTVAGITPRFGLTLFAAVALLMVGAARPGHANCVQSGPDVDCNGPSPLGFNAGVQNGLTVDVRIPATVGNGVILNPITVNNGNLVRNQGVILAPDSGAGIVGGRNNFLSNATGNITAGQNGTGILVSTPGATNGSRLINGGSIRVGDSAFGGAGMRGTGNQMELLNLGIISGGSATPAMVAEGDDSVLTNSGHIGVGDFGGGVIGLGQRHTILNSGTIDTGVRGTGLQGGSFSTLTNTGFITVGNSGADGAGMLGQGTGLQLTNTNSIIGGNDTPALIVTGSANMLSNSGVITLGNRGGGLIALGQNNTLLNSGTIIAGANGVGMRSGASSTLTNSGSITVGDSPCCGSGGMLGFGANQRLTNASTGAITGGQGTPAMIATGSNAILSNAGAINVGAFGGGLVAQGGNASLTNTGTVIVGTSGIGIDAQGANSALVNGGIITAGDTGTGIQAVASSTVVNFGIVTVGVSGTGITGGTGTTVANRGLVTVGMNGVGIRSGGDISNSGAVNVGANGIGIVGQGNAAVANTGTINVGASGAGISGSATIVNAGMITVGAGGGGIATHGGNAFVTNTGTITVGAGGSGISALGGTVLNSGVISAPTAFALTSDGNTTVTNSGTLNGALALGGAGGNVLTNSGLITVGATLTPGGSVAHLVDGTFTQTGSGVLVTRLGPSNAAGNYDTLRVAGSVAGTGVANLGGTLRPVLPAGLYGTSTTYSGVLSFTSSTGRFDSVISPGLMFLNLSAVYTPTSVDLVVTRVPFNQFPTGGANARAVGGVLEANYSTNLSGPLANFYSQLLLSTAPNTLSQLTGEIATAPQNAAYTAFGQFLGTIFGQTGSARALGGAAALANPSQTAQRTTTSGGGTRLTLDPEPCLGDACDGGAARRYTFWAQGFGGSSSIDGNSAIGSSRVDMTSGGGATGIDAWLTPNALVGFTMGTTTAGYSLTDLLSSGGARSIVFGLYGGYTQGPAYVDGALAYGYSTFTSNRFIGTGALSETANASFAGSQYGGRVEGGWRLAFDRNVLTPFAGLTVQALTQSGYTETSRTAATGAPGMLGVSVQGQTTTSVRSTLGAQFETALAINDDNVLRPRLRLGWAHEFNTNRSATVTLGSLLPGAPFQVMGTQPAPDALIVSAGFDLEIGRMVRLYGQFDGDFSYNARGFSGTGGLRLVW